MTNIQEDEVNALTVIFTDGKTFSWQKESSNEEITGKLQVSPEFDCIEIAIDKHYHLQFKHHRKVSVSEDGLVLFTINHLPDIVVEFKFPPGYPDEEPPIFTVSCFYLTSQQITQITSRLSEIWNEIGGGEILIEWHTFLKFELLSFLGIQERLLLQVSSSSVGLNLKDEDFVQVINNLLDHDLAERLHIFELSTITCPICFDEKPGKECVKLTLCEHTFCRECMSMYFYTQVASGQACAIRCPEDGCTRIPLPTEIKDVQIIPKEAFQKYETSVLEAALAEMQDVVTCPRRLCQKPVILNDEDAETGLGVCMSCSFTFCIRCMQSYHGVNRCKLTKIVETMQRTIALFDAYDKDDNVIYTNLLMPLQQALEEEASSKYLEDEAVACPGCHLQTSKIEGCNKVPDSLLKIIETAPYLFLFLVDIVNTPNMLTCAAPSVQHTFAIFVGRNSTQNLLTLIFSRADLAPHDFLKERPIRSFDEFHKYLTWTNTLSYQEEIQLAKFVHFSL
eukprot:gene4841-6874_t